MAELLAASRPPRAAIALPRSAAPSAILAPSAVICSLGAIGLQLLPLVRGQLAANRQKETRIPFFQLSPSLRHLVNLGQDLAFIRLIVAHQRFHLNFGLLHTGTQVNQLLAMLLHDVVHSLPLLVGQLQPLYKLRIIPPASVVTLWPHRSLKWGAMVPKSRPSSVPATLRER
jgi:hypothetical protein